MTKSGHEAPNLEYLDSDQGSLFTDQARAEAAEPTPTFEIPQKALGEIARVEARRKDPRKQAIIDTAEQQMGGRYAAEIKVLGPEAVGKAPPSAPINRPDTPESTRTPAQKPGVRRSPAYDKTPHRDNGEPPEPTSEDKVFGHEQAKAVVGEFERAKMARIARLNDIKASQVDNIS